MTRKTWMLFCIVAIFTVLLLCGTAAADDDDVVVDDLSDAVFRKRQKNRRRAKSKDTAAAGSADDDEFEGVNDFADLAHDARFDGFGADTTTDDKKDEPRDAKSGSSSGGDDGAAKKKKKTRDDDDTTTDGGAKSSKKQKESTQSKREKYEEHRRAYEESQRQDQERANERKKAVVSKFKPRYAADSANVSHLAENILDEIQFHFELLNTAARQPESSIRSLVAPAEVPVEEKALWREIIASMEAFPHGLLDGAVLDAAKAFLTRADRSIKKIEKRAEEAQTAAAATNADRKARKAGKDADRAEGFLTAARAALVDAKAAFRAHRRLHELLANTGLASSVASSSLAKAQLALAEELLSEVRASDDGGVGDREGRQRRKEIKELHKFATQQIDAYSKARKHAQQLVSSTGTSSVSGVPSETWLTLVLKNLIVRKLDTADWPIASSGDFSVPITLRLFGLTDKELLLVVLVSMVPYVFARLIMAIVDAVRRLVRKPAPRPRVNMPGAGRALNGRQTEAGGKSMPFTILRHFIFSIALTAALCYFAPTLSLPALPHVSPASVIFVLQHFVTAAQLARFAVVVVMIHLGQVIIQA